MMSSVSFSPPSFAQLAVDTWMPEKLSSAMAQLCDLMPFVQTFFLSWCTGVTREVMLFYPGASDYEEIKFLFFTAKKVTHLLIPAPGKQACLQPRSTSEWDSPCFGELAFSFTQWGGLFA